MSEKLIRLTCPSPKVDDIFVTKAHAEAILAMEHNGGWALADEQKNEHGADSRANQADSKGTDKQKATRKG